ncbi:MAG: hypothetical protein J6R85_06870, partial [Lentisphaeria bacterium]|nr:hypothetical protein [Lentisphaeria bacterium]
MKINSPAVVEVAAALPFNQGAPRINGPTVYGASPKRDFLYYIPVRGERPLKWSIIGELPPGLTLNGDSGVISGKAEEAGIWKVTLQVSNRLGTDTRPFRIEIAEDHLALTPMLGWTSWNAHSIHVTGALIRRAADLLCSTGLREFGYSFVNTDSCWQGHRPSKFSALVPNERFPEMGAMVDYIHRKGLKAGIYSTPMVVAWGSNDYQPALPGSTGYPLNPDAFQEFFGGCGKTHFEEYDARQFAEWKFDYLKYDWPMCDPYYTEYMSKALRATGRDFIYCLTTQCKPQWISFYRTCVNMCRERIDTMDQWEGRIGDYMFPTKEWLDFNGPGHWLDWDMLALGDVSGITKCTENRLTENEKITHMAVWAYMASPLQLSCDLGNIDALTMALFTNEELLDINQDEAGKGAVAEVDEGSARVYCREMANGDLAVAFINAGEEDCEMVFQRPGMNRPVRDVLARQDLGEMDGEIRCTV